MKKLCSLFCLLSLIGLYMPAFASVNVPSHTPVIVSPDQTITSKNTLDTYDATIKDDVTIDGVLIFRAGDKAKITIGEHEKARCWGKGGKLVVSNGYIYDVNGQSHKILLSRIVNGEDKAWPKVCGVVSIFFLWPLALFGFVHGEQATIPVTAEIDGNTAGQFIFTPIVNTSEISH